MKAYAARKMLQPIGNARLSFAMLIAVLFDTLAVEAKGQAKG